MSSGVLFSTRSMGIPRHFSRSLIFYSSLELRQCFLKFAPSFPLQMTLRRVNYSSECFLFASLLATGNFLSDYAVPCCFPFVPVLIFSFVRCCFLSLSESTEDDSPLLYVKVNFSIRSFSTFFAPSRMNVLTSLSKFSSLRFLVCFSCMH